ncbi:putative Serine/threonine-protein kinase SAPK10 [Hibiscus syriacus]|uniref:Serine/threonine-protein kinase SAPK10 n=1 Tax=Hibiscus syriacus TaxID=106335 RepID=A0A6A3AGS5_HIBSY|nr:transcription factor HHO5-like [Hibiscus syriacus]KAE8703780.1 putative Serine/threonine-protein kinase SAPK10 [Hibiscus syriacus]
MDLRLDLSLVYVPKSITKFLQEVSKIKNGFQRLSKISDYIRRLEDETNKINAFKRELPLCMLILKDVIERLKEEEIQCKEMNDGSLLPLKGNTVENGKETMENDGGDMKNWMSSVQLWNSDSNNVDPGKKSNTVTELKPRSEEQGEDLSKNPMEFCNKKSKGGAFVPFKEHVDKKISGLSLMTPSSGLHSFILKNNGGCRIGSGSSLYAQQNQIKFQTKSHNRHEDQQHQQQNSRKQRRCWSPELHRRFVEALQQLGGSQVATPKQIRELMQVDGLTNDEVKSHLQKYRLHIQKIPASPSGNKLCSAQNQSNEHSKASISRSGSPQGPLLASGSAKDMSSTVCESMDTEDEKSDGHSWTSGAHKPGDISVYSDKLIFPHEFCRNMEENVMTPRII